MRRRPGPLICVLWPSVAAKKFQQEQISTMSSYDDALVLVIAKIRSTINEDWVADFDIDAATRFNDDLELESIEFVKIADAVQQHYGARLDIVAWLSGKTIHELISLSVGDLAGYIASETGSGTVGA